MTSIVVHDFSGHPFQAELSRELARRGHSVLHLASSAYVSGKGALALTAGDPACLRIEDVAIGGPLDKYTLHRRLRQELRYARRLIGRLAAEPPEVVISSNTPLLVQRQLLAWSRRANVPVVFWQQDVYSVAMRRAAARRLGGLGDLLGRAFERVEADLLRRSAVVVCISDDFVPLLERWGVPRSQVEVIENWAPLDEVRPMPRRNRWSAEQGLDDALVFLYAGTLGMKHDPRLLLELAEHLQQRGEGVLVVVSEGPVAAWLGSEAGRRGVRTLRMLPFQPYDRLPEVLASGDVLLAILEPSASVFSVPSKTLTYHCAGRALLAAVPEENLCARVLRTAGSGLVVDPRDRRGFVDTALRLADDAALRDRLGRRARAYAATAFDIRRVGDRFEAVVGRALAQDLPAASVLGRAASAPARSGTPAPSDAELAGSATMGGRDA